MKADQATSFALLKGLREPDRRRFLDVAQARQFKKGEPVFVEGDRGDSLHLVSAGTFSVRVVTLMGHTAMLSLVGPGAFFGELALLEEEGRRSATITALEQSQTLAVYRADFTRLRQEQPSVDRVLLQALAVQVRELSRLLVDALYTPVEARVYRRLLEAAALWGEARPGAVVPLTQEDVAELAGTTRPTVNRILRHAEEAGLLQISRGRVRLIDPEAMDRRAALN